MKYFHLTFLFFTLTISVKAQAGQETINKPSTYAVVIGISSYKYPGIDALMYAHRDADKFVQYLKSDAGGALPDDHIRRLTNQTATYSAILQSLQWLINESKTGDLIYFYYSGHGDVENTLIDQFGFLLSYDSPNHNFMENSLSIDLLNSVANTLTLKNGARVIMITDACRSGKLTESSTRRNAIVGEQLRTINSKEIRIASCKPEQLSNEDQAWGGGRGVFSYYLLNGLCQHADLKKDGVVTLQELKQYLETAMKADPVLKTKPNAQSPVVQGSPETNLAKTDPQILIKLNGDTLQQKGKDTSLNVNLKPLPKQASAYFFEAINHTAIENIFDFTALEKTAKEEIPFAMIQVVRNMKERTDDQKQLDQLEKTLKSNAYALKRFKEDLVEAMGNRGQSLIAAYLEGDQTELEKRKYYNQELGAYDNFPAMYRVALMLSPAESFITRMLKLKMYYFSGIGMRLKSSKPEVIDSALALQHQALKLQPNAPFIHNELGVLHTAKKNYTEAEKFFLKATQISPGWAIPWSNLSRIYAQMNQTKKGLDAGKKATELQGNYYNSYINKAVNYEQMGNWLMVEHECYKSLQLNTKHYKPFELLAYACLNTTRYALADSFFYESDLRKKGKDWQYTNTWVEPIKKEDIITVVDAPLRPFRSKQLDSNIACQLFVLAMYDYQDHFMSEAERKLKNVLRMEPTHPLAAHYLSCIAFDQKNWPLAEQSLLMAQNNFKDSNQFKEYLTLISPLLGPDSKPLSIYYKTKQYKWQEDDYRLGNAYLEWHYPTKAEALYRAMIHKAPQETGAYVKLWEILETSERYAECEQIILRFRNEFPEYGDDVLYRFYTRMIDRQPEQAVWELNAGTLTFNLCEKLPTNGYLGRMTDTSYHQSSENPAIKITAYAAPHAEDNLDSISIFLPGIMETITLKNMITDPLNKSISHFRRADTIITEGERIVASVYQKLGDLYRWNRMTDSSIYYYQKSLVKFPANAGSRIFLAEQFFSVKNLEKGFEQLDSLYQRKESNLENLKHFGELATHAGRFEDADTALNWAVASSIFDSPDLSDLQGRLYLMWKRPEQALPFYVKHLTQKPDDAGTCYSLSRLYMQMQKSQEASEYLQKAMNLGFHYVQVLNYDPVWENLRTTDEWTGIIQRCSFLHETVLQERRKESK
ncbi:MAG: caspase family protein [Chitinophagaceae bacterium]|nr:caspase family protein [Chitinophagaceae bacterium]